MDQLNMLSLAFEIRTDVAAKWSVNALLLGCTDFNQKEIEM